jgi:DNA (cytosine-5)-methyltransferase 1
MKTLRINGLAREATPRSGDLVIDHDKALKLLLAAEAGTEFPSFIREELPAIISHWMQSPKDAPILVKPSFGEKWLDILRTRCQIEDRNPASGPSRATAHAKPVHIDFSSLPFPPVMKPAFTFIDLFAGIGGFRIALSELGGKCVFTSEWDQHAKETYYNNYGEVPFGDITNFTKTGQKTQATPERIPSHNILCGGFPCQPFSQAGKQLGFNDARGTLFFDILTIAKKQRPEVLFLENVKRLKGHDNGKTFQVICNSLREIGYKVYAKVIRAFDHGVPQNRERIFIVAFSKPLHFEFPKESRYSVYKNVGEVLETRTDPYYTISDRMWEGHQRRLEEHRNKGNGFGYSLFDKKDEYVNTISARYWKDGSEILIKQNNANPRILTPRECARIQGYPEIFKPHESRRWAYQQFGNSVAVPVISAIAESIIKSLNNQIPACQTLEPMEAVVI